MLEPRDTLHYNCVAMPALDKLVIGFRTGNARLALSPQERHSQPVISSMEYGWQSWGPSTTKRFGKVKCAETKITDAQILGPRHVDVVCPATKMYF